MKTETEEPKSHTVESKGQDKPKSLTSMVKTMSYPLFLLILISSAILFCQYLGIPLPSLIPKTVVEKDASLGDTSGKIAMLRFNGVISGMGPTESDWLQSFCDKIEKLSNDNDVKSIILEINSPGGEVGASDRLHDAVLSAKKRKPIVAYIPFMAASGGYQCASATTWIVTDKDAYTGSIGVIMKSRNISGTYDLLGIQAYAFKSGEMKDMLSRTRPLHEKEIEYAQMMINRSFEEFVMTVAKNRKLTPEEVKDRAGDGRIILGDDAVKLGLADEVGNFDDAVKIARKLGNAKGAKVVLYPTWNAHGLIQKIFAKNETPLIQLNLIESTHMETMAGTEWNEPSGIPLLIHAP